MKILPALLFCSIWSLAQGQETAYKALNEVGAVKGQTYLDNLVGLEGLGGRNQPPSWKLTFEDAASRAGVREIEVQNGQLIGQRTPVKGTGLTLDRINLDRLQLDSDGALSVAEKAASQQKIRFERAHYLLQAEPGTGDPIWRMQLLDSSERTVFSLRIAASTGRVLANGESPVSAVEDSVPVRPVVDEVPESGDTTEMKIHRTLSKTGRRIGNGFKHVGGSLQQVFTGKRTIDADVQDE